MNEKGFTLIEVMISMMLVGILAIAFIPIISSQYANIARSGDKSESTYEALKDVENKTADPKVRKENVGDTIEKDNTIVFGGKTIKTDIKEVVGQGESTRTTQKGKGKGKDKDKVEETILKVGVPVEVEKDNQE